MRMIRIRTKIMNTHKAAFPILWKENTANKNVNKQATRICKLTICSNNCWTE